MTGLDRQTTKDTLIALRSRSALEYRQLITRAVEMENPEFDREVLSIALEMLGPQKGIPEFRTPCVGELVKFKLFDQYTSRNLHPWAWLLVLSVDGNGDVTLQHHNGTKMEGEPFVASAREIDPPLGWERVYQVVNADIKEINKVRSWLLSGSGVAVWVSHDLGTAGRRMFTRGDADHNLSPHWSMRIADIVTDPARIELMHVIKTPVPTGYPTEPCPPADYDELRKAAQKIRKRELARLRAKDITVNNIKCEGCIVESWYETNYKVDLIPKSEECR